MSSPSGQHAGGSAPAIQGAAAPAVKAGNFLGLEMEQLAGLSVDELVGNRTAITMVMHYYKQLSDENTSLRNDLNTAQTYVSGYGAKKTNGTIGAVLQGLATLFVGFGINLLTGGPVAAAGVMTLLLGVVLQVTGMYFSLKS